MRVRALPPVLLAVAVTVAATSCSPPPRRRARAAEPSIAVRAGQLLTIPESGDPARERASSEVGRLLADLYSRAFLPPRLAGRRDPPLLSRRGRDLAARAVAVSGHGTAEPTPVPRPPVDELFSPEALSALAASREAFAPGDGVRLDRGLVSFSGVATVDDQTPTSALVTVEFSGTGRARAPSGRSWNVRLSQSGQLFCVRSGDVWRVAGFEVRLSSERARAA